MTTGQLSFRIAPMAMSPLLALLAGACSAPAPAPQATASATEAGVPAAASVETTEPSPVASPVLPMTSPVADGPARTETPVACSAEIGEGAARRLVQRCVAVSPATHPPCNVANSCAMVRGEIARGCALLDDKAATTPECGGDPVSRKAATDVIARYYSAINAHDYATAWGEWGPDGGASGKTLKQFARGFAQTRRTHVEIGKAGEVEGAAGSLYLTVPVTVDAELTNGRRQRFGGTYVLRRINRGMGPSQGWHIESAKLGPI